MWESRQRARDVLPYSPALASSWNPSFPNDSEALGREAKKLGVSVVLAGDHEAVTSVRAEL